MNIKSFKEFINEEIKKDDLIGFWNLLRFYNIDYDDKSKLDDNFVKWNNDNISSKIKSIMKNKKFQLLSKILFYCEIIKDETDRSKAIFTVNEFENSLNKKITIWRGGEGVYNPNYKNNGFVSFTAKRNRANTFSIYSGTYAQNSFMLNKNQHYWIIELKCKLDDIWLYYDLQDNEVIIDPKLAKNAKLIEQK